MLPFVLVLLLLQRYSFLLAAYTASVVVFSKTARSPVARVARRRRCHRHADRVGRVC